MVLRLEVKDLRLAEEAKRLIVFLTAGEKVLVRQVGQTEHHRGQLGVDHLQSLVDLLGFRAHRLHFGENRRYILPFFLPKGDLLVHLVLLCLDRLGLGDQISSLSIEREDLRDLFLGILALLGKSCEHFIGIFFDISNV